MEKLIFKYVGDQNYCHKVRVFIELKKTQITC